MKLDFSYILVGLDGIGLTQDKQSLIAGRVLATQLATGSSKENDLMKFMDWAFKLYKDEIIDLDRADQKLLREYIIETQLTNLVKNQLLNTLDFNKSENGQEEKVKHGKSV